MRWGWLRENPAASASPGPGQVPQIHPPAPVAVLALLQRAEQDDKAFAVLVLAAVTGARRGEPVALRWSDLDLELGASPNGGTAMPALRTPVVTSLHAGTE